MRTIANHPTAKDLKELGVAVRTGERHGTLHTSGWVACGHCGGTLGSLDKIAIAIGVSGSTLSKWLKRGVVRDDLARTIRASFARIEE
jgi:hypothetical protein